MGPMLKMVVVGDSGVGKSSLLLRYCDNEFSHTFQSTVGVDFKIRSVVLPTNGRRVKLQIWDTAGQERFRAMTRTYYRGALVLFLVFAIDQQASFASLMRWLDEARQWEPTLQHVAVLANKCDAHDAQTVSHRMARDWAESLSLRYYEVSAKTGEGVAQCFEDMAEIVSELPQDAIPATQPQAVAVNLAADSQRKRGGCCGIQ